MRAPSILLALSLLLVPPLAEASRKPGFKKSEFMLEYRGALDRWARGSSDDALSDLIELESRTVVEARADLEPLWKAKLSVIRDLLRSGPEILVPVSQLHERAYLEYLARGERFLAAHSRSLTIELAELYADRVKDAHGKKMASAVMTSLAGYLHAAFMDSTAASLYRRAAEIDPSNAAALLGLAGLSERHGEYDEATLLLRKLVAEAPENAEGRLRLAVHVTRLNRPAEAKALLLGLIERPTAAPRWIRSLAYQELVRMLIDGNELEGAIALVNAGVRALPGDPTLPILLAYVTDRAGRPSSKSILTRAMDESSREDGASPRYRYSQVPQQALEEVRASLRGESAAQLPTLAAALGSGSVSEPAGSR